MLRAGVRLGGMLLLAVAVPVQAQFAQLAATDDGKQVYFTSQLFLQGAAAKDSPAPETRITASALTE